MTGESSDVKIRFACQCGKKYSAKSSLAGRLVVCKECGKRTVIPCHAARTPVEAVAPAGAPVSHAETGQDAAAPASGSTGSTENGQEQVAGTSPPHAKEEEEGDETWGADIRWVASRVGIFLYVVLASTLIKVLHETVSTLTVVLMVAAFGAVLFGGLWIWAALTRKQAEEHALSEVGGVGEHGRTPPVGPLPNTAPNDTRKTDHCAHQEQSASERDCASAEPTSCARVNLAKDSEDAVQVQGARMPQSAGPANTTAPERGSIVIPTTRRIHMNRRQKSLTLCWGVVVVAMCLFPPVSRQHRNLHYGFIGTQAGTIEIARLLVQVVAITLPGCGLWFYWREES